MTNNTCKIKDLPKHTRPYEKCLKHGVKALSDAELLAIIIKTGTHNYNAIDIANNVMNTHSRTKGLNSLMHLRMKELLDVEGIGTTKAITLLCIGEIYRRISQARVSDMIRFDSPEAVGDYYIEILRHEEKESVIVMMLDSKNRLIKESLISVGTVNLSLFSNREILRECLSNNAVNIIIVHNHPSGDSTPSNEDISVTRSLYAACELIGLVLIDHVIIGDKNFFSFRQDGLL